MEAKKWEKSEEHEEEGNLIHIEEDFKCLLMGILKKKSIYILPIHPSTPLYTLF